MLLRHFGEEPPQTCGNCDNCLSPPSVVDATETARKLLSAVYRTGQSFGLGYLEKVLTGQADERVSQRQHDRLSVFGIVEGEEQALLKPLSRALQARGALVQTEHGGLALGGDAREILRGEVELGLVLPPAREGRRKRRGDSGANPVGDPLFEALRAERRRLAQDQGVPPYVIFHDATLREIAATRPSSLAEMGAISGIGSRKLEAYGEAFLDVVRQH